VSRVCYKRVIDDAKGVAIRESFIGSICGRSTVQFYGLPKNGANYRPALRLAKHSIPRGQRASICRMIRAALKSE